MKLYDDCTYCGGDIDEKTETMDYRYHGQLFIIENVPMGVCTQCGERFLTAKTAKHLETLAKSQNDPVTTIAVPVLRAS